MTCIRAMHDLYIIIQAYMTCSHWCCKEDVNKPVVVQRTKIVQAYREGYYQVKIGETNCGTFGWSKCTLYGTRTQ